MKCHSAEILGPANWPALGTMKIRLLRTTVWRSVNRCSPPYSTRQPVPSLVAMQSTQILPGSTWPSRTGSYSCWSARHGTLRGAPLPQKARRRVTKQSFLCSLTGKSVLLPPPPGASVQSLSYTPFRHCRKASALPLAGSVRRSMSCRNRFEPARRL